MRNLNDRVASLLLLLWRMARASDCDFFPRLIFLLVSRSFVIVLAAAVAA
jgi:hypothetical protein